MRSCLKLVFLKRAVFTLVLLWGTIATWDFWLRRIVFVGIDYCGDSRWVYSKELFFEPLVELLIERVLFYCGSVSVYF
jgi:hypothetical protein